MMKKIFSNKRMSRALFLRCQRICFQSSSQHMFISTNGTIKKLQNPEDPHKYYKWGYKPLPVQTSLDHHVPEFAIRSPKFKLPKLNKERLTRKKLREKFVEMQKARINLEKLSRNRQLLVSLAEVEEEWMKSYGLIETQKLSQFYGINHDLYEGIDVMLETLLEISFCNAKVYRGNFLGINDVLYAPTKVAFNTNDDFLYTLVLSNLDGHPLDRNKELVHWVITNIKGSDLSSGHIMYDYLPPVPWKGTGFHRLVFSLYKHHSLLSLVKINDQNSLVSRTFSTSDFISSNNLLPVGLSWFQVQWEDSVTELCKKLSDLTEEPIFDWNEYIEPKKENILLLTKLNEIKYRNM
ncbi:large ribosomal subunit protein mL38-like isoform X2 [Hydra vulgaris]|uniref:Large ribosomal subunit protein mL38 n=2 Tax=Hydra vulgaris TaxID=6087 RepID=A0ABM4DKT9_HYDVU